MLIWDGICEVQLGSEWLSGDRAISKLGLFVDSANFAENAIAESSWRAVELAASSGIMSAAELTRTLYFYNRYSAGTPCPLLQGEYDHLIVELGASFSSELGWVGPSVAAGWYHWKRRGSRLSGHGRYKVYVNVEPMHVPQAIAALSASIARSAAVAWKLPASVLDLRRPDKFCVYFAHSVDQVRFAQGAGSVLKDLTPHVTPFSFSCTESPHISLGIDPEPSLFGTTATSWRTSICAFIAAELGNERGIVDARGADWRRLALPLQSLGFDPFRWKLPLGDLEAVSQRVARVLN